MIAAMSLLAAACPTGASWPEAVISCVGILAACFFFWVIFR